MIRQKTCALYKVITSCYDTRNNAGKYTIFLIVRKKKRCFLYPEKDFSLAFLNKPVQKDFGNCWK